MYNLFKGVIMVVFVWILQILLGLHTLIGALWKFSHTAEKTAPSLAAIPQPVWIGLSVFEIICAALLILPLFNKKLTPLVPLAAIGVALEMIMFSGVHMTSAETDHNPMIYWLVVAALCAFVAYRRTKRKI